MLTLNVSHAALYDSECIEGYYKFKTPAPRAVVGIYTPMKG